MLVYSGDAESIPVPLRVFIFGKSSLTPAFPQFSLCVSMPVCVRCMFDTLRMERHVMHSVFPVPELQINLLVLRCVASLTPRQLSGTERSVKDRNTSRSSEVDFIKLRYSNTNFKGSQRFFSLI